MLANLTQRNLVATTHRQAKYGWPFRLPSKRRTVEAARWREGDTARRQELAFSLYPEGLRFSRESLYFEPHNTLLMNTMQEMIAGLADGSLVGVPDGI